MSQVHDPNNPIPRGTDPLSSDHGTATVETLLSNINADIPNNVNSEISAADVRKRLKDIVVSMFNREDDVSTDLDFNIDTDKLASRDTIRQYVDANSGGVAALESVSGDDTSNFLSYASNQFNTEQDRIYLKQVAGNNFEFLSGLTGTGTEPWERVQWQGVFNDNGGNPVVDFQSTSILNLEVGILDVDLYMSNVDVTLSGPNPERCHIRTGHIRSGANTAGNSNLNLDNISLHCSGDIDLVIDNGTDDMSLIASSSDIHCRNLFFDIINLTDCTTNVIGSVSVNSDYGTILVDGGELYVGDNVNGNLNMYVRNGAKVVISGDLILSDTFGEITVETGSELVVKGFIDCPFVNVGVNGVLDCGGLFTDILTIGGSTITAGQCRVLVGDLFDFSNSGTPSSIAPIVTVDTSRAYVDIRQSGAAGIVFEVTSGSNYNRIKVDNLVSDFGIAGSNNVIELTRVVTSSAISVTGSNNVITSTDDLFVDLISATGTTLKASNAIFGTMDVATNSTNMDCRLLQLDPIGTNNRITCADLDTDVSGDYNIIHASTTDADIVGDYNHLILNTSRDQIDVTGNGNKVEIQQPLANFLVNGNNNDIVASDVDTSLYLFSVLGSNNSIKISSDSAPSIGGSGNFVVVNDITGSAGLGGTQNIMIGSSNSSYTNTSSGNIYIFRNGPSGADKII